MPAATQAPFLDGAGKETKQVTLDDAVFAAEIEPHLVHEAVRAELNAARAGTRGPRAAARSPAAAQSRGARRAPAARHGTTRAALDGRRPRLPADDAALRVQGQPQGKRAALRAASPRTAEGTMALIDGGEFGRPRRGRAELVARGSELPLVVVLTARRRPRASRSGTSHTVVTTPQELEVVGHHLGARAARLRGRARRARAGSAPAPGPARRPSRQEETA